MKGSATPVGGRAPLVSLAAVALSAVALPVPELFELSRAGLERGQLWRFLTGHLTHYSIYHFAVDSATLLVLGWLAERRFGARRWAVILLLSGAAVSVAFLLSEEHLEAYRGLSGIDCAALAAALVAEARRRPLVALAVSLGLVAKLTYEQLSGGFIFPAVGLGDMGEPVLSAHSGGGAAGLLFGLLWFSTLNRTPARSSFVTHRRLSADSNHSTRPRDLMVGSAWRSWTSSSRPVDAQAFSDPDFGLHASTAFRENIRIEY